MLLKLDTHDKQDNDTVNTLKNCYNDVYANIMHNDHILCYRKAGNICEELNFASLR